MNRKIQFLITALAAAAFCLSAPGARAENASEKAAKAAKAADKAANDAEKAAKDAQDKADDAEKKDAEKKGKEWKKSDADKAADAAAKAADDAAKAADDAKDKAEKAKEDADAAKKDSDNAGSDKEKKDKAKKAAEEAAGAKADADAAENGRPPSSGPSAGLPGSGGTSGATGSNGKPGSGGAEGDSKAADDKAEAADKKDHADDREIQRLKKEAREARRKARALRRAARKALRDLAALIAQEMSKAGKPGSKPPSPLEDPIKDLEDLKKKAGADNLPSPPASGIQLAQLIDAASVVVAVSGTGETIGHIADLKIQDLTDQPLTCAIPPMILESGSGKNQHYVCPSGQTVALNPHQTKTVPMNGVCLNRNKPPVAKGVIGDLVMNEANPSGPQNPNSHLPATDAGKLLRSCAAKYTAADQLQKSGALKNLPYHDPQKQKDIVVQWSTWSDPQICQIVGTTPATKGDLKKVVYKQIEEQGPMSPATRKKVDQGIDIIFEKVELTTAKAKDLEKPGPFFEGPVSTGKPGPLFKPATVVQPGDVVHVEEAPVGAKGHWMVKVKLPSGEIVEVWFETDDKPPLEYCNYIKINKTGTSASGKNTVIEDYERTTPTPAPTPAPTPTATATPKWKSYLWTPAPTPTPTATPKWKSFLWTPAPTATQPPQSPGGKTEPEKKDEGVKPTEPLEPPFELPNWLKPWWEATKYAVDGSEFAGALPGGKDSLGAIIARLNVEIRKAMIDGNEEKREFYEQLKKKLTDIYNSMSNE